MDDQTFKIVFEAQAVGAVQGAQQVAQSLSGVAQATDKATTAIEKQAAPAKRAAEAQKSLKDGVDAARNASLAFASIAQGDYVTALSAATAATKGLNVVLRSNPIGLLLSGIAAATGLWLAYRDRVNEAAGAEESVGKKADAAEPHVSDLAKAANAAKEGFQQGAQQVAGFNTALENLVTQARAARTQMDSLSDAETGLKLAQIGEQERLKNITPGQAAMQSAQVRADAALLALQRERATVQAEKMAQEAVAAQAGSEAGEARTRAGALFGEAEKADRQAGLLRKIRDEQAKALEETLRSVPAEGKPEMIAEAVRPAAEAAKMAEAEAAEKMRMANENLSRAIELEKSSEKAAKGVEGLNKQLQVLDTRLETQRVTSGNEAFDASKVEGDANIKRVGESIEAGRKRTAENAAAAKAAAEAEANREREIDAALDAQNEELYNQIDEERAAEDARLDSRGRYRDKEGNVRRKSDGRKIIGGSSKAQPKGSGRTDFSEALKPRIDTAPRGRKGSGGASDVGQAAQTFEGAAEGIEGAAEGFKAGATTTSTAATTLQTAATEFQNGMQLMATNNASLVGLMQGFQTQMQTMAQQIAGILSRESAGRSYGRS